MSGNFQKDTKEEQLIAHGRQGTSTRKTTRQGAAPSSFPLALSSKQRRAGSAAAFVWALFPHRRSAPASSLPSQRRDPLAAEPGQAVVEGVGAISNRPRVAVSRPSFVGAGHPAGPSICAVHAGAIRAAERVNRPRVAVSRPYKVARLSVTPKSFVYHQRQRADVSPPRAAPIGKLCYNGEEPAFAAPCGEQ